MASIRPDIPFLIVEGRSGIEGIASSSINLKGIQTVHRMANTSDPTQFYRVSKLVLMPSLVAEGYPRVPVEAMINGIPVLGSGRGGMIETLSDAGQIIPIPEHHTADSKLIPTAEEVQPWITAIEKLWDDPEFYRDEQNLCLHAAQAWHPDVVFPKLERFLENVIEGKAVRPLEKNG
jgi:glycosyltransferase involved in cell wall biosynthesis